MNTQNTMAELRKALHGTVDSLQKRRACDIPETYIEDYVMLDWMTWEGGGLKLTTTGENIYRQETLRLGSRAQDSSS